MNTLLLFHKYKTALVLLIALAFFAGSVTTVKAIDIRLQIQQLQAEIAKLQKQLADLTAPAPKNMLNTPDILAQAYMVVDVSDNSVILQKNSEKEYPIASVTKLMNAVVTVENIDLDKTITLRPAMLKPEGYSPSIFLNLNISAKNLLSASLIQSTNDAAESLTYFVGNEKFMSLMNQKAKDLGMSNTYFYDAYGINSGNHSTAKDLSKLVSYIYKNHPEIFSITKQSDFWLPDPTGKLLKFKNVNSVYQFPEFIGGKSGYIPEAKQTLASLASVNGKTIAIVLLQSENRRTDASHIVDWLKNNF